MRRALVVALVFVLGVIAASVAPRRVEAGKPCTIPKEWGQLRAIAPGAMGTVFAFEAEDGTIRTVPAGCKSPAAAIDTLFRE